MIAMEKQTSVDERRKYQRVPKEVSVQINKITYPINDNEFASGKSMNISQGGVLLNLTDEYQPGDILQIKVTLPGWRKNHPGFINVMEDSIGSPFSAICEVVRSSREGDLYATAVKFVNIDKDDFTALNKYLSKIQND